MTQNFKMWLCTVISIAPLPHELKEKQSVLLVGHYSVFCLCFPSRVTHMVFTTHYSNLGLKIKLKIYSCFYVARIVRVLALLTFSALDLKSSPVISCSPSPLPILIP